MKACVYFVDPSCPRLALFFTACDETWHALNIATALQRYFRCAAWIADWNHIAHTMHPLEQRLAAIHRGDIVIDTTELPLSPNTVGDPRR
jgi:hypothetical protein